MNDYWQKQNKEHPLFEDLIWSRPVNKRLQGKLLIIGGNLHAINAPSLSYSEVLKQRIGSVKVLMPDKTARLLPQKVDDIEFLPSTPSGSFSQESLEQIKLELPQFDAVLLAGDFAKNSETSILLEKLADLPGMQIYAKDALDSIIKTPKVLLDREDTLLVIDFARLQKFISASGFDKPLTSNIELLQMVNLLHEFGQHHKAILLTKHNQTYYAAYGGQVITTALENDIDWPVTAAAASVWWLQHAQKPLEAIATSLV